MGPTVASWAVPSAFFCSSSQRCFIAAAASGLSDPPRHQPPGTNSTLPAWSIDTLAWICVSIWMSPAGLDTSTPQMLCRRRNIAQARVREVCEGRCVPCVLERTRWGHAM